MTTRLPRDRPLWAATLLIGEGDGRAALVLVFHHVLADGIAGLAVLGRLVDGVPSVDASDFPRPAPSLIRLALDSAASRVRSVRRVPVMVRRLTSAVIELGPSLRTQATPCSLNRPTGTHRRVRTVRSDLTPVIRLAHQNGATVNDVILSAITGALHLLLAERGEHMPAFVVSIPVSSRPQVGHGELGNQSGVVPVLLPATGTFPARLASTAQVTRAAKSHQRGASTALLGPFFRVLATMGIYQRFIDHQRLIHTFVSNLKGPETAAAPSRLSDHRHHSAERGHGQCHGGLHRPVLRRQPGDHDQRRSRHLSRSRPPPAGAAAPAGSRPRVAAQLSAVGLPGAEDLRPCRTGIGTPTVKEALAAGGPAFRKNP